MGTRLNDNVQEALQFLMLGSGIVLGSRLAYLGVAQLLMDRTDDPLAASVQAFGHGYLLADANTLVVLGMNIGGRMALAFVLALLAGILMALLGVVLARLFNRAMIPFAVGLGRAGLLVAGAWGLFAAFALPPITTTVESDGLLLSTRPAFLGELSWPLPASAQKLAWTEITAIEARTSASSAVGCGSWVEVVVTVVGTTHSIAGIVPEGRDCNEALHFARWHTEQLAQVLDGFRAR